MEKEPAIDAECKDKFLIQLVPVGESADPLTAFDGVEKEKLIEKKLKVSYLPPEGLANIAEDKVMSPVVSKESPMTKQEIFSSSNGSISTMASDKDSEVIRELKLKLKNAESSLQDMKKKYEATKDQMSSMEKMQRQMVENKSGASNLDSLAVPIGIPPIMVALVALFAFLLGLMF